MNTPVLTVSSSPHLHEKSSTSSIMYQVSIALLPALAWGVYAFGLRALLVVLVSIAASMLSEYLLGRFSDEFTLWDGSALLTGLLIGLNMSSSVPLFIPAVASAFAIIVAKWTFGGLGANWANPALAGRIFVFFSFTTPMSTFVAPRTLARVMPDAIASATPLGLVKTAVSGGSVGLDANALLAQVGYPATNLAQSIAAATGFNAYTIDSFLGNVGGCIGRSVPSRCSSAASISWSARSSPGTSRWCTWPASRSSPGSSAVFSGLGLFGGSFFPRSSRAA